jgi:long-chain acyl-CoA synthetase
MPPHTNCMNIVEPILFQCKLNPITAAVCVPGSPMGPIPYSRLEAFIHNVARNSLKSGIGPGKIVATYISDAAFHITITLGLMHAGAITLSLRGPSPIAGITPDIVLTDRPAGFPAGRVVPVDPSWLEGDGAATPVRAKGGDDDLCRIILTSGSTGVAKGVAFSHRVTGARNAHYMYSKGPRPAHCARFFCDLGISTSPGFSYAMSILSRGGTVFFLGSDPTDILQTIDLHQIEGMATTPYGLGEFLKFFEADHAFETSFDHIICQGAMMSPQLSQRARARMCQNLYSSYGSTETSTVAFGPASVLERIPGSVGFVQPGVIIEAVNGLGEIMPSLHDGLLRIRNAHMGNGYVGDPEASAKVFRDGYFYTGDVGHVTPEGILVITGREKTALNIGGDTVNPESIEDVVRAFNAIEDAAVFAANNDLGIAELTLVFVAAVSVDVTALQRHCSQRLPSSCVPVRMLQVEQLPRGGQGKLERQRLPELVAAVNKPP